MGCHALCHRNPEYFERPNQFYPNHFLGQNGELLTRKSGFGPFSVGQLNLLCIQLRKLPQFHQYMNILNVKN